MAKPDLFTFSWPGRFAFGNSCVVTAFPMELKRVDGIVLFGKGSWVSGIEDNDAGRENALPHGGPMAR